MVRVTCESLHKRKKGPSQISQSQPEFLFAQHSPGKSSFMNLSFSKSRVYHTSPHSDLQNILVCSTSFPQRGIEVCVCHAHDIQAVIVKLCTQCISSSIPTASCGLLLVYVCYYTTATFPQNPSQFIALNGQSEHLGNGHSLGYL